MDKTAVQMAFAAVYLQRLATAEILAGSGCKQYIAVATNNQGLFGPMSTELKTGSIAAIIQALCYIFGFALLATVMNPGDTSDWNQLHKLEYLLEHKALFQLWNTVIYVVFGVALVVLATVLHRLLQAANPLLVSIATAFGLIWAGLVIASGMVANIGLTAVAEAYGRSSEQALNLWQSVATVQDGLGGGVEIVGGLWVLLLSLAANAPGTAFPRPLTWLGFVVGIAGITTIVPALSGLGAIFGLTQIVWFIAVGVVLWSLQASVEHA